MIDTLHLTRLLIHDAWGQMRYVAVPEALPIALQTLIEIETLIQQEEARGIRMAEALPGLRNTRH